VSRRRWALGAGAALAAAAAVGLAALAAAGIGRAPHREPEPAASVYSGASATTSVRISESRLTSTET
jgi:hypothetical protein